MLRALVRELRADFTLISLPIAIVRERAEERCVEGIVDIIRRPYHKVGDKVQCPD